jgi:DNA-binding transcriptional regulator GbsR (MarR family)
MELIEGKEKFLHIWGTMSTQWGVSRAMAEIHGLLLFTTEPISAEDIMEYLKMSRGNVHINLHTLMDWNLIQKVLKVGERREFFVAEKDIWIITRNIMIQRKKRELEPLLKSLDELSNIKGEGEETENFIKLIKDIKMLSSKVDVTLENLIQAESQWIIGTFLKLMK